MNKTKKIFNYIMSFVLALILAVNVLAIMPSAFKWGSADSEKYTVQFEQERYAAETGKGNTLVFTIKMNTKLSYDLKVSYHTESYSAIEGIDFVGIDEGTATIAKNSNSTQISISFTPTEYVTVLDNENYSRTFLVVLDETNAPYIDDTNEQEVTVGEKNIAYGVLSGSFNIPIEQQGTKGFTFASEYHNFLDTGKLNIAAKAYKTKTQDNILQTEDDTWYRYTQEFDASVYASFYLPKVTIDGEFDDLKQNFWLGAYDQNGDAHDILHIRRKDATDSDADSLPAKGQLYFFENGFDSPHNDDKAWIPIDKYDLYGNDWKILYADPLGGDTYGNQSLGFVKVPYRDSANRYSLRFKNELPWAAGFATTYSNDDYVATMRLVDDKDPVLLSTNVDDSALARTKKIRFTMRFDEPVYATDMDATVTLFFYRGVGGVSLDFKYVGGNYSDTLVFEAQAKEDNVYSEYSYSFTEGISLRNNITISDLSYHSLKKSEIGFNNTAGIKESGSTLKKLEGGKDTHIQIVKGKDQNSYTFDYNRPTMKLVNKSGIATDYKYRKTQRFDINIDNTSKAKVYYVWDTNSTLYRERSDFKAPTNFSSSNNSGTVYVENTIYPETDNTAYFLHVLVVAKNGLTVADTSSEIYFDVEPPSVAAYTNTQDNTLASKMFTLTYNDKHADITTVDVILTSEDGSKTKVVRLYDYRDGYCSPNYDQKYSDTQGGYIGHYVATLFNVDEDLQKVEDGEEYVYPIDEALKELLGDNERASIGVRFRVQDSSNYTLNSDGEVIYDEDGNYIYFPDQKEPANFYTFDIRRSFKTEYDFYIGTAKQTPLEDIAVSVYDIKTSKDIKDNILKISIPANQEAISSNNGTFALTVFGSNLDKLKCDKATIVIDPDDKNKAVITAVNDQTSGKGDLQELSVSGLMPGRYCFTPTLTITGGGVPVTLVSDDVVFYVTNDKTETTTNYDAINSGNLVLINEVQQLQGARFYFMEAPGGKVQAIPYGAKYDKATGTYDNSGSTNPTFSSVTELKKYIMFMEYQDLYLVTLNEAQALSLKTGVEVTYKRAQSDENIAPQVGQRWIRYKRSSWMPSNNSPTDWVFYYLDNNTASTDFSVGDLYKNPALIEALNNACEVITDSVLTVHLVEGRMLSSNNAPYLAPEQIFPTKITASQTMMGSKFFSSISYEGDKAIYKNITVDGVDYPLASNYRLKISPHTVLYYRHNLSSEWTRLLANDDAALREALSNVSTGVFEIREIDDNGMHEFLVYIDTDAPRVNVKVTTTKEYEIPLSDSMPNIACNKFEFVNMEGELDEGAYVAIFSYPQARFLEVIPVSELAGKTLAGNYYVRIGDRSGNLIDITLLMKVDVIEIDIAENEYTGKVAVKCTNRNQSEISFYEVKCNGNTILSKYTNGNDIFDLAGVYTVDIIDIYGLSEHREYTHSKTAPNVTWYYLNENSNYVLFDKEAENQPMSVKPDTVNTSRSNVITSRCLRLKLDSERGVPKFAFTGLTTQDYTLNSDKDIITINKVGNWLVKVWYEEDESYYKEYYCIADETAPEIEVSFMGPSFTYPDSVYLNESFTTVPNSLQYKVGNVTKQSVTNGSVITAEFITISATDVNGIRSLQVYINNKLVDNTNGRVPLKYFDEGDYRIVATDNYGNARTFTLSNSQQANATFSVDDSEEENEGSLASVLYGNQMARVILHEDAEVEFLVTINGIKKYYRYNVVNGVVTYGNYAVLDDEDGIRSVRVVWDEEPVYVFGATGSVVNDWVYLKTENGYSIALMARKTTANAYGYVLQLAVVCLNEMQQVEIRVVSETSQQPAYRQFLLSKAVTDIPVFSGEKQLSTNHDGEIIFANNVLTLGDIPEEVTLVEVAYSPNSTRFNSYVPVYGTEETQTFSATTKGFYSIKVTNRYGNVFSYTINLTDASEVLITVTYADGVEEVFSSEHEGVIRSNYFITIQAYGNHIFTVDGVANEVIAENDVSKFGIYLAGMHTVVVTDMGGSSVTLQVEIGVDPSFVYDESWITDFVDGTVTAEEHFTKNVLSLAPTDAVYYIGISYRNDNTGKQVAETAVYDKLTDNLIDDEQLLNGCLATYGDGVYTISFRGMYGDLVTHTVNYRQTSTLSVTRITALNGNGEECDISEVTDSVYSSNSIIFRTSALNGRMTVNGSPVSLNPECIIKFNTLSGEASFEYPVVYTDEYGFVHTFNAILLRRNIEIDTSSMTIVELRNKLYTMSLVKLVFDNDYMATVEYDGKPAEEYLSGTKLSRDGEYFFTVYDVAGNATYYSVIRNSYCKFAFIETGEGREVISGMATNAGVTFRSLGNNTQITKIVYNGKEITDRVITTFTDMGHWELFVEDEIGNTEYFEFIIVNHSIGLFKFDAPYGYTVSEVWYTTKNAVRQLTSISGPSITLVEDGLYYVVVTSKLGDVSIPFSVTIDTSIPGATLNGVKEGGSTINVITIENLSAGDTVYVYRDGSLVNTYSISSSSDKVTISKEGKYRVVVINQANVSTEFKFEKKFVANTSGSVLIMIGCGVVVLGLFFGLLYRSRSRTDK